MPSLRLKSIKVTPEVYFQLESEKELHQCRSFSNVIELISKEHKHGRRRE